MATKTKYPNIYEYKSAKGVLFYRINYLVFDTKTGAKTAQRTKSGFKSKSEAKSYLIKMEYEVRAGTYVDAKKTILAEYLRDWIESRKREIRKNTYDGYKVNIEHHIISNIGNMKLQNIRRIDIENLYTKLLKSGRHDGKGGLL